jgi:hypothetical protein
MIQRLIFCHVLWLGLAGVLQAQSDSAHRYLATISEADLKKHLRVIAADSMEGRATGSQGQQKAASYLVSQFQRFGLASPVANSPKAPYRQRVPLFQKRNGQSYLELRGGKQLVYYNDYVIEGNLKFPFQSLPLVFGGYGLQTDHYNDFAGLNLQGKGVVILYGAPEDSLGRDVLQTTFEQRYTLNKVQKAYAKGAAVVFVVDDDADQFMTFVRTTHNGAIKNAEDLPTGKGYVFVNPNRAAELLGADSAQYQNLVAQIALTAKSTAGKLKNTVTAKFSGSVVPWNSDNILALIEGTDKKAEVVVISAHYDHIGLDKEGRPFNGADDDGSGTAALLEIAEAFAKAKAEGHGPRRSILFLANTAEEMGLVGSAFYTSHPVFPLSNTVANLNMDMIGRVDAAHAQRPDYIYLIGSDRLSIDLHRASERAASRLLPDLVLDYTFNRPSNPNQYYYRSDHYSFAVNSVPAIFYFAGEHDDYHQITDDVDKINFPLLQKRAQLVFATAWEIANQEERLKVNR